MVYVFIIVLDLARMKLTFYTAALWVLCSAFMARNVLLLVAHLCFGYCRTCLHSIKAFSLLPSPPVSRLRAEKRLGGDTAKRADQIWSMHYLIPYDILLSSESSGRGGRRDLCGSGICLPKQPLRFCLASQGAASAGEWQTLLTFLSMQLLLFLLKCHCLYL